MATEQVHVNPYKPDQGVIEGSLPETRRIDTAVLVAAVRRSAYRAWLWPIAGILLWLSVDYFYVELEFWLIEVPGFTPPNRDSIMGGVVALSSSMWLMGCTKQIVLLSRFRQIPSVRKHFFAGVLASGVGVLIALNSMNASQPIVDYGGGRGPSGGGRGPAPNVEP